MTYQDTEVWPNNSSKRALRSGEQKFHVDFLLNPLVEASALSFSVRTSIHIAGFHSTAQMMSSRDNGIYMLLRAFTLKFLSQLISLRLVSMKLESSREILGNFYYHIPHNLLTEWLSHIDPLL